MRLVGASNRGDAERSLSARLMHRSGWTEFTHTEVLVIDAQQIKPDMPVVCSEDGQFAVVDHLEGQDSIKLKKDSTGKHHFIPVSWVTKVDDQVHIDRPGRQAMKEWRTEN
jgi:hypothetical protein